MFKALVDVISFAFLDTCMLLDSSNNTSSEHVTQPPLFYIHTCLVCDRRGRVVTGANF